MIRARAVALVALLAVAPAAGCAAPLAEIDQRLYLVRRTAVVSVYGPVAIQVYDRRLVGYQAADDQVLVRTLYRRALDELRGALALLSDGGVLGPEQLARSTAYAARPSGPPPSGELGSLCAPAPLVLIAVDDQPALASLARGLGIDAVASVRLVPVLRQDVDGPGPVLALELALSIVAPDGSALWSSRDEVVARADPAVPRPVPIEEVRALAGRALDELLARFKAEWLRRREEGEPATLPPPATTETTAPGVSSAP